MKYTNQKALKQFILAKCKQVRSGWELSRVSKEALDHFEMVAAQLVRRFEMTPTDRYAEASLLVRKTVKTKLLEGHKERFPWVKCVSVNDDAITRVEIELERLITNAVSSHPSKGKTFII